MLESPSRSLAFIKQKKSSLSTQQNASHHGANFQSSARLHRGKEREKLRLVIRNFCASPFPSPNSQTEAGRLQALEWICTHKSETAARSDRLNNRNLFPFFPAKSFIALLLLPLVFVLLLYVQLVWPENEIAIIIKPFPRFSWMFEGASGSHERVWERPAVHCVCVCVCLRWGAMQMISNLF